MNNDYAITNCPNGCIGELFETNMFVAEGALRECGQCGQILSSCTRERYDLSNQDWDKEEGTWPSDKDFKRLRHLKGRNLKVLSRLLLKNNKRHLLDIGCSNGAFISYASNLGWNAEGVDPSPKAVQDGIHRGLKIHLGYLRELKFKENTFDAITLYEVIEHVDKPKDLLGECHRILKPGGALLVGTGNVDSWTCRIMKERWDFFDMNKHGGHISFFSPKSLRILSSRTGFIVKQVRTSSVKIYEKEDIPWVLCRTAKILTELLNFPARLMGKGHQMEVYLEAIS